MAVYWLNQLQTEFRLFAKPLVVRTFLLSSNTLKETVTRQCPNPQECSIYRSLTFPRYVWVSEYGYLEDWKNSDCAALVKRGELIFDATLPPTMNAEFLVIHIPGEIILKRIVEDRIKIEHHELAGDGPSPLLRPRTRP